MITDPVLPKLVRDWSPIISRTSTEGLRNALTEIRLCLGAHRYENPELMAARASIIEAELSRRGVLRP